LYCLLVDIESGWELGRHDGYCTLVLRAFFAVVLVCVVQNSIFVVYRKDGNSHTEEVHYRREKERKRERARAG
jgi:hypothetical protein